MTSESHLGVVTSGLLGVLACLTSLLSFRVFFKAHAFSMAATPPPEEPPGDSPSRKLPRSPPRPRPKKILVGDGEVVVDPRDRKRARPPRLPKQVVSVFDRFAQVACS